MERLTTYISEYKREMICRYEDCMTDEEYCPHLNEDNCPCLQEILEKLANYENLEKRLQNIYGDHHGLLDEVVAGLERHEKIDLPQQVIKSRLLIDESVDQWEEYKTLDKQGKLLKLPCAVGDTVYVIPSKANYGINIVNGQKENNRVHEQIVDHIEIYRSGYLLSTCDGISSVTEEFYRVTWFLTREEADTALEELERGYKEMGYEIN